MQDALLKTQILSTVVLTLTLVAIALYTWKTWHMADATRQSAVAAQQTVAEMREARDQESRPYVLCGFETGEEGLVYFYVRNLGKTVATDVRLVIEPPLSTSRGPFTDLAFVRDSVTSLVPGQEIRTLFDSGLGLFDEKLNIPLRYS